MPAADLQAAFGVALDRLDAQKYATDPAAWAWDKLGVWLWSKQAEVAQSVVHNRRTSVRSSNGVGKSLLASVLCCWWAETHPADKTMVISTAPSHDQVHGVLWENVRELHRNSGLRGTVQQKDRWVDNDGRLIGFGRRPPDHSDSAFVGYHRPYVLMIIDEAGGIPEWLWETAEALTTGPDCRILSIGNPTDSSSHFAKLRGSSVWKNFQISTFDTPLFTGEIDRFPAHVRDTMRASLPSQQWVADARQQWGEESSLYKVRVLGEFADRDDGLIPLSWVAKAQQRWLDWYDAGQAERGGRRIIACDPAWLGEDKTAIAVREADVIREVRTYAKQDTVETTDLVDDELDFPRSVSIVDVNGIGTGVVDQLRHRGRPVTAFNGSKPTKRRDASGQWKFRNCLTEDARVRPVGDLRRIYSAPYQGPLFEIETAGGDHFTATANHQVLTADGWVSVQSLNVGDQLVDAGRSETATAGCARPEIDDVPPTLGEVYRAAARLFGAERVDVAAVNFHGDRPAGEVDVVAIDGDLLAVDPAERQQAQDLALILRLVAQRLLPPEGAPSGAHRVRGRNVGVRPAFPGDGVPCRPRRPLFETKPIASQAVSLSVGPAADAALVKNAIDGAGVNVQVASDRAGALSAHVAIYGGLLVEPHAPGQRNRLRDGAHRHPGPVQRAADDAVIGAVPAGQAVQRLTSLIPGDHVLRREIDRDGAPDRLGLAAQIDAASKQNVTHPSTVSANRATQRGQGLSSLVATDEVVSVKLCSDALHGARSFVYTLETSSGTYSSATVLHKNCRQASWYAMRDLLDPALGATLCLPAPPPNSSVPAGAPPSPAEILEGDLTAPNYREATGGFYLVEEKSAVQRRIGRSPDVGDAVTMAMWMDASTGNRRDDDEQDGRPRRPRVHTYDRSGSTFGDSFAGLSGGWN